MSTWSGRKALQFFKLALPVGAAGVLALLVLISWIEIPKLEALDSPVSPQESSEPARGAQAASSATATTAATVESNRVRTLRSGDTLSKALLALGFPGREAQRAADAASRYVNPRQLRPGMRIAAYLDGAEPARFALEVAGQGELSVERGGEEWLPSWRPYRREVRTRAVQGVLAGSLESAVAAAGANPELAYAMADVLQWDLDFNRDLQRGDRFEVLFQEVHLEGRYFGLGRVLALTYDQSKRKLEAFRYGNDGSFYDGEGRPTEKMFLRAPLPYSRVTSKFSKHRFHPVLKIVRPHYGVDYGAPVGTPVRVTAAGTVLQAAWSGGGGKTIKVRHPNGFVTCYLHLSRYAAGIRAGARVRQGDLIGYVGSTGLASGPHLDYRVQRNGDWIDPQSLKSVPANPLDRSQLADFRRLRDAMRAALERDGSGDGSTPFVLPDSWPGATGMRVAGGVEGEPVPAGKTSSTTRK